MVGVRYMNLWSNGYIKESSNGGLQKHVTYGDEGRLKLTADNCPLL